MLVYSLNNAFEDVSLAAIRSGTVVGYDRRVRAAALLHTLVRAGRVAGLPDDPQAWPSGHPVTWIVATMCQAGPAQPVDGDQQPAESSPWALREAANEMRIGLDITAQQLDGMLDDDRAQAERDREHTRGEIDRLLAQADSIERDFSELPAEDELADYDTDLAARQPVAVEWSADAAAATSVVIALLADAETATGAAGAAWRARHQQWVDAFACGEASTEDEFDVLRDHDKARRDLKTATDAVLRRFGNL